LSAIESITDCASWNSSAALVLSPATTAFCTFLTTVRKCERSEVFSALRLTSWRARFRPDARRTVFFLAFDEVAIFSKGLGAKPASIAVTLGKTRGAWVGALIIRVLPFKQQQ